MSDHSPRLALPYMQAAQAQKHITHNEALERLDLLVQLTVEGFDAETPPLAPQEGQVWALGAAPSGDWGGQGGRLAAWLGAGWLFVEPAEGWLASLRASPDLRQWSGSAWVLPNTQNLPGLGVGAGSDPVNRLVVAGAATLLTHEGAGHQLKVNKAAPAETASLLFQTGWSGRAEMGTAGSDDFAIKTSADGSAWTTALSLDAATGAGALVAGLTVDGHAAFHRGNVLGALGLAAGVPTGALIDGGSGPDGTWLRLADGTQLCRHVLNLGDPTVLGTGVFADPWRTAAAVWTYPAGFVAPPAVLAQAHVAGGTAADRRMAVAHDAPGTLSLPGVEGYRLSASAGTGDCLVALLAVGRWA